MENRLIVLSGCSGGGKSTLLDELGARGFATFEEPGRQIVKEQRASGGNALPWTDPRAFIELALERSIENWDRAQKIGGTCVFDRGIVDAANHFVRHDLPMPAHFADAVQRCRYHRQAFLVPPWKENFATDAERRHGFEEALAEYESLLTAFARFGYESIIVPKLSTNERVEFVLRSLNVPEAP